MLFATVSCLGLLLSPSALGPALAPQRSSLAAVTMMGREKIKGDRVTFIDGEGTRKKWCHECVTSARTDARVSWRRQQSHDAA